MALPTIRLADGSRLALADGSRVAVTRQDNDLTKPASVQSSFSNTFGLADVAENHKALESASEGTSASSVPYRELGATLEVEGLELLARPLLQVNGYEPGKGYDVQLYGGNRGFFARLGDKKLRDLDLSRFGHNWTAANIFAGLGRPADAWALGYCYELLDRGKGNPAPLNSTSARYELDPFAAELYPSTYARAVFEQIVAEAGFSWRGSIPESFNRMTVPASKAYGYSPETRAKYKVRAGQRLDVGEVRKYEEAFRIVAPFDYIGGDKEFTKGPLAQYNTSTATIPIQIPGFYNVRACWHMALECDAYMPGRVIGWLRLYKRDAQGNETQVGEDEVRTGSNDAVDLIVEFMNQRLEPGDSFYCILEGGEEGGAGPFSPAWYWGVQNTTHAYVDGNHFFELELLEPFPPTGPINLVDWLPDMLQSDFVKAIIFAYALQQRPDPYLDVIEFRPAVTLFDRLGLAPVWDGRRDARRPAQVKYQLPGSFGRKNWLKWKEDDTNGDANKGLGDAFLVCPDEALDASKDILTMPFAASPSGAEGFALVPKWKVEPDSNPVTYGSQTPAPRLLLRSRTRSRTVYGLGLGAGLSATVPLSYFTRADEPADLSFSRTLAPAYYRVLAAALAAPRVLRDTVRLDPADVVEFDQLTPVFIEAEGHYFYVNKIEQYEVDLPTTSVDLIRLYI